MGSERGSVLMIKDYQVDFRTIDEMRVPGYKGLRDDFGVLALTEEKRRAFVNNPYLVHWNNYCQQVCHVDGVAFGCEVQFPLRLKTPVDTRTILAGSTTFVAKEYRKCGAGAGFSVGREQKAKGYGTAGSSMSQMMVRVYRMAGVHIFDMPRYILLFRSRPVVEMKLRGALLKFCSMCVDCALSIWYWLAGWFVRWKCRGLEFVDVSPADGTAIESAAQLVAQDPHQFAEVHDAQWFMWMMTESFEKSGPMSLTLVKRGGETVGFYMTKKRFHEQASSRGFKNVWLGSIMEWQVKADCEKLQPWILARAALAMRKQVDACELLTVDGAIASRFKRLGALHVGDGNYAFSPSAGDPLWNDVGLHDVDCWRMRPALCDAGLN